jgi:hypothetical protein
MLHSFQPNNLDKNRNYIYYLVTLDFSPGIKGRPSAIYHPFRGLHPSKTRGLQEMEPITRSYGRDFKKYTLPHYLSKNQNSFKFLVGQHHARNAVMLKILV